MIKEREREREVISVFDVTRPITVGDNSKCYALYI